MYHTVFSAEEQKSKIGEIGANNAILPDFINLLIRSYPGGVGPIRGRPLVKTANKPKKAPLLQGGLSAGLPLIHI